VLLSDADDDVEGGGGDKDAARWMVQFLLAVIFRIKV
jgi:hypothetical protein